MGLCETRECLPHESQSLKLKSPLCHTVSFMLPSSLCPPAPSLACSPTSSRSTRPAAAVAAAAARGSPVLTPSQLAVRSPRSQTRMTAASCTFLLTRSQLRVTRVLQALTSGRAPCNSGCSNGATTAARRKGATLHHQRFKLQGAPAGSLVVEAAAANSEWAAYV
jgi:hypothetical protein